MKLNPEKVQTLAEVKPQIESTLGQQTQQEYLSEFVADFESKWQSRTVCADGFVIEKCAQLQGRRATRPTLRPPATKPIRKPRRKNARRR